MSCGQSSSTCGKGTRSTCSVGCGGDRTRKPRRQARDPARGNEAWAPPAAYSFGSGWLPPTTPVSPPTSSPVPPNVLSAWSRPSSSSPSESADGTYAGNNPWPRSGWSPGPVSPPRRKELPGWVIALVASIAVIVAVLVVVAAQLGGGGGGGGGHDQTTGGPGSVSESGGTASQGLGTSVGPSQDAEVVRYLSDERALDTVGTLDVGSASVSGRLVAPRSLRLEVCPPEYYCDDSQQTAGVGYDLGRHFRRFQATAGLSDDAAGDAVYLLKVLWDGRKIAGQQMRLGDVLDLNIDITGILRLQLLVTHLSGDQANKHKDRSSFVVFGDARMIGKQSDIPGAHATASYLPPATVSPPVSGGESPILATASSFDSMDMKGAAGRAADRPIRADG